VERFPLLLILPMTRERSGLTFENFPPRSWILKSLSIQPRSLPLPSLPNWELFGLFRFWEMAVENLVNRQKLHERVYPFSSMDNIKFGIVSHLPLRISIILL
jgi:hypothetical protein